MQIKSAYTEEEKNRKILKYNFYFVIISGILFCKINGMGLKL